MDGQADRVGETLLALLSARDPSEVESAYWGLENHVVVQGGVYDSAVPVTRVLVAALLEDRPLWVRISILDLLFQILSGATVETSPDCDLIEECKHIASGGLWLFVREFVGGPRDAARDVLECLEIDFDYESLV